MAESSDSFSDLDVDDVTSSRHRADDVTSITSDYLVIEQGSNNQQEPAVRLYNYSVHETNFNSSDLDSSVGLTSSSTEDEEADGEETSTVDLQTPRQALSVEDELRTKQQPEFGYSSEELETLKADFLKLFADEEVEDRETGTPDKIADGTESTLEVLSEGDDDDGDMSLSQAVKEDVPHLIDKLVESCPSHLELFSALMLSLSIGRDHIAKLIVENPKYEQMDAWLEKAHSGAPVDVQGPEEAKILLKSLMTPIMLASLRDRFSVVKLLLSKGQTIEEPHSITCSCDVCSGQLDGVLNAKFRLTRYQAIATESYITLAHDDPIHRAFQLGHTLQGLAESEKYYKHEYADLARQCSSVAVRVLDQLASDKELGVTLKEKYGSGGLTCSTLARLILAVRYGEKRFVAHPACQKKLHSLWIRDIRPTWINGLPNLVVFLLLLTVCYPFLFLAYWVYPKHRVAAFLHTPFVKFLASTSSYLQFVAIAVGLNVWLEPSTGLRISQDESLGPGYREYLTYTPSVAVGDQPVREHAFGVLHSLLLIWVLGMVWEIMKKLYQEGRTYFTDNMFNILNFTQMLLYSLSFGFYVRAVIQVSRSISYFSGPEGWQALSINNTQASTRVYWLDADRSHWSASDPMWAAEATFALGTILTICKIPYCFIVNERIGPIILSLGKMVEDVVAFMVLFVVIVASFCLGFHNLYWYYYSNGSNFRSVRDVIELYFWSIFGLSRFEGSADFDTDGNGQTISITGLILYGFYNWLMVIILINMLIAMMSRSYTYISEYEDTEWKFARTKLFLEYMREGSPLCAPYNLVPTQRGIGELYRKFADVWCYKLARRRPPKPQHSERQKEDDHDPSSNETNETNKKHMAAVPGRCKGKGPSGEYKKIMKDIKEKISEKSLTSRDTARVEQMKHDLSSLRQELIRNVHRQYREQREIDSTVLDVERQLQGARSAFERQHAFLVEFREKNAETMRTKVAELDNHINRVLSALLDLIGLIEVQLVEQVRETHSSLAERIHELAKGVGDVAGSIHRQHSEVTRLQCTLELQVADVDNVRGKVCGLEDNIIAVKGTFDKRKVNATILSSNVGIVQATESGDEFIM